MTDTQAIRDILNRAEIRPTNYRIRILECLEDKKAHPTVEELYRTLSPDFPSLTKMSVYNTLDILEKAGLVRSLTIETNEIRYDSLLSPHGHFKCQRCGKITNFAIDLNATPFSGLEHFTIKEKDIFFKGICADCMDQETRIGGIDG